jgi:hypothetical protein
MKGLEEVILNQYGMKLFSLLVAIWLKLSVMFTLSKGYCTSSDILSTHEPNVQEMLPVNASSASACDANPDIWERLER